MKLNLKKLTAGLFSVLVFSLSAQTVQQRVDTAMADSSAIAVDLLICEKDPAAAAAFFARSGMTSAQIMSDWTLLNRLLRTGTPAALKAVSKTEWKYLRSADGANALHLAVWNPDPAVAETLVKMGCDPAAGDDAGNTPFHEAVCCRNIPEETLDLFLEKTRTADISNKNNATPLHFAIASGNLKNALYLIKHGASPTMRDKYDNTPITLLQFYPDELKHDWERQLLAAADQYEQKHTQQPEAEEAEEAEEENDGTAVAAAPRPQSPEKTAASAPPGVVADGEIPQDANKIINMIFSNKVADLKSIFSNRDPDVPLSRSGVPALHFAAQSGKMEIVKLLLEAGANKNILDNSGMTVLHKAASSNALDVFTYFVENGADINAVTKSGNTPLHVATRSPGIITYCVKNGADIRARNKIGETFLHTCARVITPSMMEFLVENKVDLKARDRMGRSVLHHAAEDNNFSLIKYLTVKHQFDLTDKDNAGMTILLYAIRHGNVSLVKHMIEKLDVKPDGQKDLVGRDAGLNAAWSGSEEMIKYLALKRRISFDSKDHTGSGALYLYIGNQKADLEMVKFMIRNLRLSQNQVNQFGYTPLMQACRTGKMEIAEHLLKLGSTSVNDVSNSEKLTALHMVVMHPRKEVLDVVKLLVSRGAKVDAVTRSGKKPSDCAVNPEVREYLKSRERKK